MEHWTEYTRFLTALTVILDTFLAVPVFLGMTSGYESQRRTRLALAISVTLVVVLVSSALVARVLSSTALNVMNRLFGLIPAPMAVEVLAHGLKQCFPVLDSA